MALPHGPDSPPATMARRLYGGAASFLAVYGMGSLISFGVHVFLARRIGAGSYGTFAYATHWMAIGLLLCSLGLKSTAMGFVAAYRARGQWSLLRGLLRTATRWTLAAATAVLALALVVLWAAWPPPELARTLLLVALAMPFMALAELWSAAARGLGAVTRSQLPASIVQHLLLGLLLLLLIGHGAPREGAAVAALAFLGATLGSCGMSALLLHRLLSRHVPLAQVATEPRAWAGVSAGNLAIALLQAARLPLVVVITGAQVEPQQLAMLAAALKLSGVAALGLTGITAYASPLVAQHFAVGDRAALQQLAHLSARAALAAGLLVAALLAVAGERLLGFFGNDFVAAHPVLLVLLCGELLAAAVGPVGYFLTLTGRHRSATAIEAATSVLVLAAAVVLIPASGVFGAALAVTLGVVLRNVAMAVAVWRHHGVRCLAL